MISKLLKYIGSAVVILIILFLMVTFSYILIPILIIGFMMNIYNKIPKPNNQYLNFLLWLVFVLITLTLIGLSHHLLNSIGFVPSIHDEKYYCFEGKYC